MEDFWIQTMSGRRVSLNHTDPDTIDKMDMAHSLSMQARFNGHCLRQYSIAQHSVLVYEIVRKALGFPSRGICLTRSDLLGTIRELQIMLSALVHDSPEAYTGDIVNPLKRYIREISSVFDDLEDAFLEVVLDKYDCNVPSDTGALLHPLVKQADRTALAIEKKYLMIPTADMWGKLPDVEGYPPIDCLRPEDAKAEFLRVFDHLTYEIKKYKAIYASK